RECVHEHRLRPARPVDTTLVKPRRCPLSIPRGRCSMRKRILGAATLASALMVVLPLASASATPYTTTVVSQASSTSPFASCDVSGYLVPGEVNWVNSELERWVAVTPAVAGGQNVIGVYQKDRDTLGMAR